MKHSRLVVVLGVILIIGVVAILWVGGGESSLTVISFGGSYQAAQSKAYMKPFAAEQGIEVEEGSYNGQYGLIKERANSPQGSWDVVSVERVPCIRGGQEGLFLEIPDWVFEGLELEPGARRKDAAGQLVFSTILAYSRERFPDKEKAPKSWRDFWDVERFPGKRALRNIPRGTLEIALLSTGIAPERLYPLDLDKAFRRLDEIRDHLVFWESGALPVQLLSKGTAVMSSAFNGRIWNAQHKEELPLEWSWNQGLMEMEFWAIPKNAPNALRALKFIRYALTASNQAVFANEIAYGPTNHDAIPSVSPDILSALPNSPEALPLQVLVDGQWWAENEEAVDARWEKWKNK